VTGDEIRLVLPADPQYGRVARVAVQGLGVRLGLHSRDVEDLRIAVDETLILLLHPEGGAGQIAFRFSIGADRLVIDATSTAGRGQHWVDQGALARFDALVADTVDVSTVDELGRHVHLEKELHA
jgi:hypothetical protein